MQYYYNNYAKQTAKLGTTKFNSLPNVPAKPIQCQSAACPPVYGVPSDTLH